MKRTYDVKNNFWIGEINKELKADTKVDYDDEKHILILDGITYTVKNLKAAVKWAWLVPVSGDYPELDGPVGETSEQEANRKRKARFEEQKKTKIPGLVRDEREVAKFGGCIEEGKEEFFRALDVEPLPQQKGKYKAEVIPDDTKIVKEGNLVDNKEVKQLKKAMNQEPKEKKKNAGYKVFEDSFNDDAINVGKYVSDDFENVIKEWSGLHWSKKDDLIKKASKEQLKEIKTIESSKKIVERINKRLESFSSN